MDAKRPFPHQHSHKTNQLQNLRSTLTAVSSKSQNGKPTVPKTKITIELAHLLQPREDGERFKIYPDPI